jgi:site-specific recombinase XerD
MSNRKRGDKYVTWREMDKGNTLLQKLALQWEAFNRSDGKTARTIEWHSNSLRLFLRYLEEKSYSTMFRDVSLEIVREYILYLQQRPQHPKRSNLKVRKVGLALSSIECHVRSLRAFFNWLYQEGYAKENILARLKPPRVPNKVIEPLNQTEISALLSALDFDTAWGARDATIFLCFLDTGLRIGELVGLKTEDVHLEEGYLKVFGKGQKERIVPIGSSLQRILMRYFYHLRPEPAHLDVPNFFLSLNGQLLSENAVKLVMKRLAERSGITRLHAHLLRHTFALNYLMNGGDVFSLQQILGHTTLEMVRRYVNLASTQIIAQHHRFSPVDRMNFRQVRSLSSSMRRFNVQKRKGRER